MEDVKMYIKSLGLVSQIDLTQLETKVTDWDIGADMQPHLEAKSIRLEKLRKRTVNELIVVIKLFNELIVVIKFFFGLDILFCKISCHISTMLTPNCTCRSIHTRIFTSIILKLERNHSTSGKYPSAHVTVYLSLSLSCNESVSV